MGNSYYVILILLMVWNLMFCYNIPKCNPNNPPTLKDVTLDMISGRWFVQRNFVVLPNDGVPDSQILTEFNFDIKGSGKVVINGRTAYKPQGCLYNIVKAKPTGIRSSWTSFFGYLNNDVTWKILDTDKRSYVIMWLCFRYDKWDPKFCTDYSVNLMTKKIFNPLTKRMERIVNRTMVYTLCENKFRLKTPIYRRVCKRIPIHY